MKKVKIAIIDSGVNCLHPLFTEKKPAIAYNEADLPENECFGHGTAIYNIIRKADNIADIINFKLCYTIKMFDNNSNAIAQALVKFYEHERMILDSVKWAYEKMRVNSEMGEKYISNILMR